MGIPGYLTCLLRNLYACQEATIRTEMEQLVPKGKGVNKVCILSYLIYVQSISCKNAGLDEAQAGIKIAGRNINNLRYANDTTLMAESEEELKRLLMKLKEKSGKCWLKAQHSENEDHGIWSHHFITNRWGNTGNTGWLNFGGAPKSLQMVTAAMKLKDAYSLEEKLWPT